MQRIREALQGQDLRKEIAAQLGGQRSRVAEVETRIAHLTKAIADVKNKISTKSESVKGTKNKTAQKIIAEDIDKLGEQAEAAIAELDEVRAERTAIDTSKADAEKIAAYVKYIAGDAKRWDRANKLRALDALFGEGSLRRQKNLGAYINRKGEIDLRTNVPLSAVVAHVQPGELERPRLRPRALLPTTPTRTRSCIAPGSPPLR